MWKAMSMLPPLTLVLLALVGLAHAARSVIRNAGASSDRPWTKVSVGDDVTAGGTSLVAESDGHGGIVLRVSAVAQPLAWASFTDSLDSLGWSRLSVGLADQTAGTAGEDTRIYAAGVLEGYLTAMRLGQFHRNTQQLAEMREDNERQQRLERALSGLVAGLADEAGDLFQAQVRLGFLQTWGIRDGHALAVEGSPLSMVDMLILNSDGVIDELLNKYGGEEEAGDATDSFSSLLQSRGSRRLHGRKQRRLTAGHCTGLVRLAEDRSELYFGHTTWESFSEMTRIWKVYDFPLAGVSARRISFSSYPGCVSSTDDFYLMDSGLAITETTLNLPARQHYPSGAASAPDFLRIMAANRLATNGAAWVKSMVESATGTYSSQWLVLDYRRFSPGKDLAPGTFHVLEQSPSVSHYEDMSEHLQQEGYWASFDRAFFDDVRASTGDTAREQHLQGSEQAAVYSKSDTPRAQIVRQTVHGITSLAAMRAEMMRNLGGHEPVHEPSLRVPRFAVAARNDLQGNGRKDPDGSPDGGVDAKVTSACLFKGLIAEAVSSPSHTTLPAFRWRDNDGRELWPGYPHEGLPDNMNFDWVEVDPEAAELSPLSAVRTECQ